MIDETRLTADLAAAQAALERVRLRLLELERESAKQRHIVDTVADELATRQRDSAIAGESLDAKPYRKKINAARALVAEMALEIGKLEPVHIALLDEFQRLDDQLYQIRLKRARPVAGGLLQSRVDDFVAELPMLAASICLNLSETPTMYSHPARVLDWLRHRALTVIDSASFRQEVERCHADLTRRLELD